MEMCQHDGCRSISHNGHWCRSCIEFEWPHIVASDNKHWLLWKVVRKVGANLFTGAFNAPYQKGSVTVFLAGSNFVGSFLGALKELALKRNFDPDFKNEYNKDIHILCCAVAVNHTVLTKIMHDDGGEPALIFKTISPTYVIDAFPWETFGISPRRAERLLNNFETYEPAIDDLEARWKPSIATLVNLPQPLMPYNATPGRVAYLPPKLMPFLIGELIKFRDHHRISDRKYVALRSTLCGVTGELKSRFTKLSVSEFKFIRRLLSKIAYNRDQYSSLLQAAPD